MTSHRQGLAAARPAEHDRAMDNRARLREAVQRSIDMDAPLEARLAAYAEASAQYAPQFVGPIAELIARLRRSGAGTTAPASGQKMPDFMLPDETGTLRSLEGFLADGPLALVFDRGHWCPYCRINMATLAGAHDAIRAEGGQLVAVTPERQPYALALRESAGARFPFLSDMDNGYALSLGLAFFMGTELHDLYTSVGNRFAEYQGSDTGMVPIPATFVIAPDGTVAARFIEPDYRRRMEIDDLIAAVAAARLPAGNAGNRR
jgi:peroxiredoxin